MGTANVRTVLVSAGTTDILADASAGTIDNELVALVKQIRNFYADNPKPQQPYRSADGLRCHHPA